MSQSLAVPSSDPLTIRGNLRREGQQDITKEECSTIFLICFPVSTSHALTVLSELADTIYEPSPGPVKIKDSVLVTFQNHKVSAVSMNSPEAITVPAGLRF